MVRMVELKMMAKVGGHFKLLLNKISRSRLPWVGLGATIWVQIATGNSYNFPLNSSRLKSVLGYSQQQVTILGVANDIGENVGLLSGYVCNKFPPSSLFKNCFWLSGL
ncbi:Nodulin-like [Dillenia turbinata]|uniref:Nodulin-like n=1 Tax=Dillenia turbinata TaxID=194707 RepID=A0AAN8ZB68_9MAGN